MIKRFIPRALGTINLVREVRIQLLVMFIRALEITITGHSFVTIMEATHSGNIKDISRKQLNRPQ